MIKSLPLRNMDLSRIKGGSAFGDRWHPIYDEYRLHEGIDYGASIGTPIYSVADGQVIVSKMQSNEQGYGNYIVIRHENFDSLYAHMSIRSVNSGKIIRAGQQIGEVGTTGDSTGPHLHLGFCESFNSKNKGWFDPLPYLQEYQENQQDAEPPQEDLIEHEGTRQIRIQVDGRIKTVNTVNIDGYNFVKLRDLDDVFLISYDEENDLPILVTRC